LLIHSKRSKRHMSLKQHKKCGSFDLDGTFHK
jgi:ribonuclease P protein subunit POP4